jgi:hypothetical protein
MKTPPTLPIALTEVWLPSLRGNLKPSLIIRSKDALIAKLPLAPNPSPATIRQLTAALETFHPASAGCREISHRELYHNPVNNSALLVFWIPEGSADVPHYAAKIGKLGIRTRRLRQLDSPQISGNYNQLSIERPEEATPEELIKRKGKRLQLRNARQAVAHILPGLIKIVVNYTTGTIKTSFEGCSIHKILKHRELYASTLTKFGFPVTGADTDFKMGTWRVKDEGPKKKHYHVLTLNTPRNPEAKPSSLRVDFTATWARKLQPKTEEEIDKEISEIFINRESLIKRLRIKTTTRK